MASQHIISTPGVRVGDALAETSLAPPMAASPSCLAAIGARLPNLAAPSSIFSLNSSEAGTACWCTPCMADKVHASELAAAHMLPWKISVAVHMLLQNPAHSIQATLRSYHNTRVPLEDVIYTVAG